MHDCTAMYRMTIFNPSFVSVCSFPDWSDQLPGPHSDVFVLLARRFRTTHEQVPVVETIPHLPAVGMQLCIMQL